MSMNYAQAVSSGKAPKPSPVPTPEKKVEAPKPQPVTTADQAAQPAQQSPVQEAKTYEGNKGGPVIGQLTHGVHYLAHALSPADLIALGSTCKHLFTMFLNTNTWNLTQSYKLPKTSKAFVRLEVRVPLRKDDEGEEAGFSTSDVEADGLVTEGNTIVVYPSFFRREQRKQQLVQIWQNQAAKIQKSRDKVDENADPLTTSTAKKTPLSMKFPGGFAVSFRDAARGPKEKQIEKSEEFLARGIDLSEVASWLDGVYRLINGDKKVQFNTAGGNLSLTRYGRGGSMLVAKSTGKTSGQTIFSLSDFAVQVRAAAKEFVPILGRLNVIINHDSKNITGKEEGAAYLEFEKCVASAIKQEKLVNVIGKIKSSLERGSIPHSNIQQLLQKKREKKKAQQKASESENSNILDFIYANLPKDLEDVRRQAEKQTEDAKQHREQKSQERKEAYAKKKLEEQAAKEKKQEEKKNKQNQKNNQKTKGAEEAEEDENKKKTTTKTVKTKDDEGFVTVDTEYKKKGETGEVVTAKASDKLKSDIEKANVQKSKKTENQGTDVVLQNNPYAQIKRAGGLQSQNEIQAKINKQKGEKRNAENNESQPKGVKAPPPPKQKPQQKKQKPAKENLKSSSGGNSSSDSETSQQLANAAAVGVNPQPVLMGAFALAIAVLSYVFLLS